MSNDEQKRAPVREKFDELQIDLTFDQPISNREVAEIQRFLRQELDQSGEGDYYLW